MRKLMLLRHAKSDWHSDIEADYDRPLNHRGQKAIQTLARAMQARKIRPGFTLASPARRSFQTVTELYDELGIGRETVHYLPELYLADLDRLLAIVDENRQADIALVGHNPGLEALLVHLCGDDIPLTTSGKRLPTASLAVIQLPDDWTRDSGGEARLDCLLRPKELESAPVVEEADT